MGHFLTMTRNEIGEDAAHSKIPSIGEETDAK
jgi:hypothetical protein